MRYIFHTAECVIIQINKIYMHDDVYFYLKRDHRIAEIDVFLASKNSMKL